MCLEYRHPPSSIMTMFYSLSVFVKPSPLVPDPSHGIKTSDTNAQDHTFVRTLTHALMTCSCHVHGRLKHLPHQRWALWIHPPPVAARDFCGRQTSQPEHSHPTLGQVRQPFVLQLQRVPYRRIRVSRSGQHAQLACASFLQYAGHLRHRTPARRHLWCENGTSRVRVHSWQQDSPRT